MGEADLEHETTRCLDRAKALVCGDRARDYGPPSQDHARTAALWRAYLGVEALDGYDVCQMMILLKASRARHCRKPDNEDDQAGYAQNAAWIRELDARRGEGPEPSPEPEPSPGPLGRTKCALASCREPATGRDQFDSPKCSTHGAVVR